MLDLDLTPRQISALTSLDAVSRFFSDLGYRTDVRQTLPPEAIGLAGDAAAPILGIELLAEDDDGFLRVVFVRLKSLTAKSRNDVTRVLGRTNVDHGHQRPTVAAVQSARAFQGDQLL